MTPLVRFFINKIAIMENKSNLVSVNKYLEKNLRCKKENIWPSLSRQSSKFGGEDFGETGGDDLEITVTTDSRTALRRRVRQNVGVFHDISNDLMGSMVVIM